MQNWCLACLDKVYYQHIHLILIFNYLIHLMYSLSVISLEGKDKYSFHLF